MWLLKSFSLWRPWRCKLSKLVPILRFPFVKFKKFEFSLKTTWCIFCCVRWFNIPFFSAFASLSQCSRTQCARCTDFKQWTASGCSCGNKWRSAHCPLASPNSCSRCTFRRIWAGKSLWNHTVDPMDVTTSFLVASDSSFPVCEQASTKKAMENNQKFKVKLQPGVSLLCVQ